MKKTLTCFHYEALTHEGFIRQGTLLAENKKSAQRFLKKNTGFPLSCNPKRPHAKLTQQDMHAFWEALAGLLKEKMPLHEALKLMRATNKQGLRCLLEKNLDALEKGAHLSQSLEGLPRYCSPMMLAWLRIAEQSGQLDAGLNCIHQHIQRQRALKKRIKKAVSYPFILLCTTLLMCGVLMVWIMPQFTEVFRSFQAPMPAFTQAMIRLSRNMQWIVPYSLMLTALCALSLAWMVRRWKGVRIACEKILLALPWMGPCLRSLYTLHWLHALQMGLRASLPLHEALKHSITALKPTHWRSACILSCAQLEEGVDLARALASCPFINAQAQARLFLSQHNAHTDHTFFTMARTEEQALDQQLAKLTQKLEPCLMLIMAVLVGSLVLAIYLPIFNLGAMM